MKQIYSPLQIGIATFLSGPLAAIYFLHSNFKSLGEYKLGKIIVYLSVPFLLLFFVSMPFMSGLVLRFIMPLICAIVAWHISEKFQMKKADIKASDEYDFQNDWNIFWCGVTALLLSVIIVYGSIYLLIVLGFVAVG